MTKLKLKLVVWSQRHRSGDGLRSCEWWDLTWRWNFRAMRK